MIKGCDIRFQARILALFSQVGEAVFEARRDLVASRSLSNRGLGDSLVVVLKTHNVVLAQIVTKLHFDDCQPHIAAVSQTMIGFGRDMNMVALLKLQLAITTDNVSHAFYHDPMFATARVTLEAESRAGFHFQHFDLKAGPLFEDFVTTPWSLVEFSHRILSW